MSDKPIIGEYSRFKVTLQTCRKCGWKGQGRDCAVGDVFEGGQLSEYHCPQCAEYIRAVPWPLIGEDSLAVNAQHADEIKQREAQRLRRMENSRWLITFAIWCVGGALLYWLHTLLLPLRSGWAGLAESVLYVVAFFYVALLSTIRHWVSKLLGDY